MSLESIAWWGGFTALIGALLAIDLLVLNRKAHAVGVREALLWSATWIAVALAFGGAIFVMRGSDQGFEYLTGWLIEKSLSVDNIFVFLVIFRYFAVPAHLQPKILHWGIVGALAMRLVFILAGTALLGAFHWMIFVFGGVLLLTALRLAIQKEHGVHPDRNPVIRLLRRFVPVTNDFRQERFFVRLDGTLTATPLLIALLVVESSDVIFAVDSIPAIFAITDDPFIVFSSNAFAILGLRALYFALAGIMDYFPYLRQGLVAVLGFVGTKMIISDWYEIATPVSLAVIGAILLTAIAASALG